ncbi:site-specific integrase [Undibacterium sp. RTI2.1]|uniref:site-specific integrase n=1 Tax=unclassified Undibacterium TaxID=2630295 RepID=UPI002B222345|nr:MULTISPECIES: site-specific integrase [unclassified Undibacterium]MEB0032899.1 site-specific integrase [Undibacterium sp. RTI2.1]MEB0118804.1 site-specific integrase [Undibacterium sp. RTI2.2]
MAKAPLVSDQQLKEIIKVARISSNEHGLRNVALIFTLFATGLTPKEIAQLEVRDYCKRSNLVIPESVVRAEIAFNGTERPLMWVAPKVVAAIDAYLEHRVLHGLGVSLRSGEGGGYRGLQPKSALFLARDGQGFSINSAEKNGKTYTESNSLTRLLNKVMSDSNIHGLTTASARRTFAVKLYQNNKGAINIKDVAHILGLKSLKAAKKLVEADAVNMRDAIQGVI